VSFRINVCSLRFCAVYALTGKQWQSRLRPQGRIVNGRHVGPFLASYAGGMTRRVHKISLCSAWVRGARGKAWPASPACSTWWNGLHYAMQLNASSVTTPSATPWLPHRRGLQWFFDCQLDSVSYFTKVGSGRISLKWERIGFFCIFSILVSQLCVDSCEA